MRISTLVTMLLMVGIIMFVTFQMIQESEQMYNIEIEKSDWENRYDFATDVEEQLTPIKDSIDTIQSEEVGWLNRVGSGFTGIIAAVTFLPAMAGSVMSLTASLITGLSAALKIPAYITTTLIIMLVAWGVFSLIQFFQQERI